MDISRLPLAPLARPANTTYRSSPASSVEDVAAVRPSRNGLHADDQPVRVVQGELLQRERGPYSYQSTRSFIDERALDHAASGDRPAGSTRQSRSAVSHYLNNTRPETIADLSQGRSVNYFV